MKVLLLGTGSIGRRHATNLRMLRPDVSFVIVRSGARRDDFSSALVADVVPTLEDALSHSPGLAVVATPSAFHAASVVPLLNTGVPIYVEKPIVTTRPDLGVVSDALAALPSGVATMAGCNLRHLFSLRRLRDLVSGGELGTVARAHFECGQWLPDWRSTDYRMSYSARSDEGGGVVLDLIHELDAMRWTLGDLEVLSAATGRLSALEIDSEDTAIALLRSASGSLASVGLDYVARQRVRRYEVIGTTGTAVLDFEERSLRVSRGGTTGSVEQDLPPNAFDVAGTYVTAMAEFLRCVETGSATSQELCDGLLTTRLALDVKEAGSR